MASKIREVMLQYGKIAIGTQITISLTWYGVTYGLVKAGFDYKYLAPKVGLDPENETMKTASDITIAYFLYKAMVPVRLPIIIGAIPIVAKVLKYTPK